MPATRIQTDRTNEQVRSRNNLLRLAVAAWRRASSPGGDG